MHRALLSTVAGNDSLETELSGTWVFDCVSMTWNQTSTAQPFAPRWGPTLVARGASIYKFGGFVWSDMQGAWAPTNDAWRFDLATNSWDAAALSINGTPPEPRGLASSFLLGNAMYVVSGCGSAATFQNQINRCAAYMNDTWMLDLDAVAWSSLPLTSNTPIGTSSIAVLDNNTALAYHQVNYITITSTFNALSGMWTGVAPIYESMQPTGRLGANIVPAKAADNFLLYGGLGTPAFAFDSRVVGTASGNFFENYDLFSLSNRIWTTILGRAAPSARYLTSGSTYKDLFVIFGGQPGTVTNDLWLYNTSTKLWMEVPGNPRPAPRCGHATFVVGDTMYLFGGFAFTVAYNDVWALDLLAMQWRILSSSGDSVPSPRYGHGLVLVSESEALLFGGATVVDQPLNDTWLCTIANDTWVWTPLNLTTAPAARFLFSFTLLAQQQVVLYGGWDALSTGTGVFDDVWVFDVSKSSWRLLLLTSDSYAPQGRALHGASTQGCSNLIVVGGRVGNQVTGLASNETLMGTMTDELHFRWVLLQTTGIVSQYGEINMVPFHSNAACIAGNSTADGPRKQYPVYLMLGKGSYGQFSSAAEIVQAAKLGCNPGWFAPTFEDECAPCPAGQYSNSAGATSCTRCAAGATTANCSSASPDDCSLCVVDYCRNGGTCSIGFGASGVFCSCGIFYSGSTCELHSGIFYATLIGPVGVALLCVVAGLVWYSRQKLLKHQSLLRIIDTFRRGFAQAFTIREEELTSVADFAGTLGGSAIVQRGRFREIPVAIKFLRPQPHADPATVAAMMRDFTEETRVMQTLSHPNIVYSYGFGVKSNGDRFLVMELCPTDLQRLLASEQADATARMPWTSRLSIALGIANGLLFLHGIVELIHRDLKSPNILMTADNVPKIADFGQKMLRGTIGVFVDNIAGEEETRSAQADRRQFGTFMWNAPEIHNEAVTNAGDKYTMAADVYSLGIMMWELHTSQIPFSDDNSRDYELRRSIVAGKRPTVPTTRGRHVAAFVALYMQCWAGDPRARPRIGDVHQRLLQAHESLSQDSGEEDGVGEAAPLLEGVVVHRPHSSAMSDFVSDEHRSTLDSARSTHPDPDVEADDAPLLPAVPAPQTRGCAVM